MSNSSLTVDPGRILFTGPYYFNVPNPGPDNSTNYYMSAVEWRDIDDVYNLLRPENPRSSDIHRYVVGLPNPYTLEHAKKWVADCVNQASGTRVCVNWAIRNSRGKFIGWIGLRPSYTNGNDFQSGAFLSPEYRRTGLAPMVLRFVSEELVFNGMGRRLIKGCVADGNMKSITVVEKLGYEREGAFIRRDPVTGEKKKILMYVKRCSKL